MRPSGLNLFFGLDTSLLELEVGLLEVGQGSEDVLLYHGHHVVQMGDDQTYNRLLVLQELLDFIDSVQPFGLSFDVLALVLVVVGLLADLKFLLEALLGILVSSASCSSLSSLSRATWTERSRRHC